jgi:dCMP deaminase
LTLCKDDQMYMDIAEVVSKRSRDDIYKVGAVIAKGNKILSYGWNGTPHGMINETRDGAGNTKWEVVHAETNAIAKLAASTSSSEGATLYLTYSPCKECTKLILQAGIKRLVYKYLYCKQVNFKNRQVISSDKDIRVPDTEPLDLLKKYGVEIAQHTN